MTVDYFQPNSDAYEVNGYKFFRLNTFLSSPGDIFESKQSGHAFAIGPESDVALVRMAYFDDQVATTFMNQTQIGSGRAWNGRIDARNELRYAPSNRPGRILFWCDDLYDPNYLPVGYGVGDQLVQIPPRLDVIEFFEPTDIVPARNDRVFSFQELPIPVADCFVVLPYWGRKYASCRFTNLTPGNATITILGVNYYQNDTGTGLETQLDTGVVATTASRSFVLKAGTHGMFDALVVKISAVTPGNPTPLTIITSDTPVG